MNNSWKLKRTIQCKNCPFKCSTDPFKIPHGYDVEKHKALKSTIVDSSDFVFGATLKVMACHHSKPHNYQHCVGWLHNQIQHSNNILLRLQLSNCENILDMKVVGEQHVSFEDTLPKNNE
jgi:hypothetical protein